MKEKKQMKRILALILTIFTLVFAFASCTSGESKETEKKTEKQTEKKTDELDLGENEELEFEEDNDTSDKKAEGSATGDKTNDQTEGDNLQSAYTRSGNKIKFGSYPQAEVTDEALVATLNAKAGALPTENNKQAWTSYGYYRTGSNDWDFTWYIDITEGGERYRGVYFISYRPYYTTGEPSGTGSNQAQYGYYVSTSEEAHVYWFKYEPISWTILSEDETNKTAFILCDMIIDAQEYYCADENRTIEGETVYANNYEHSNIRKWLNKTFYETAFDDLQRAIIAETKVKNDLSSTGMIVNPYTSNDTTDKVFLLSYEELTNEHYKIGTEVAIKKKVTEYAKAQNAWARYTDDEYIGNGYWWLRTPSPDSYDFAVNATYAGEVSTYNVYYARGGVVPALQIKLK